MVSLYVFTSWYHGVSSPRTYSICKIFHGLIDFAGAFNLNLLHCLRVLTVLTCDLSHFKTSKYCVRVYAYGGGAEWPYGGNVQTLMNAYTDTPQMYMGAFR